MANRSVRKSSITLLRSSTQRFTTENMTAFIQPAACITVWRHRPRHIQPSIFVPARMSGWECSGRMRRQSSVWACALHSLPRAKTSNCRLPVIIIMARSSAEERYQPQPRHRAFDFLWDASVPLVGSRQTSQIGLVLAYGAVLFGRQRFPMNEAYKIVTGLPIESVPHTYAATRAAGQRQRYRTLVLRSPFPIGWRSLKSALVIVPTTSSAQ